FRTLVTIFSFCPLFAQETGISGKIVDTDTNSPLPEAELFIQNHQAIRGTTDSDGNFLLQNTELPLGEQVLVVSKNGYLTKNLPVIIEEGKMLDLNVIGLEIDLSDQAEIATVVLSDTQLDKDIGGADNIAGLLQAS